MRLLRGEVYWRLDDVRDAMPERRRLRLMLGAFEEIETALFGSPFELCREFSPTGGANTSERLMIQRMRSAW
jgi:hypothetical protein